MLLSTSTYEYLWRTYQIILTTQKVAVEPWKIKAHSMEPSMLMWVILSILCPQPHNLLYVLSQIKGDGTVF